MEAVDRLAATFRELGLPILSGPRRTGDGYYEFETLDPDKNRIEVTTLFRDH
jgi:lactoylglutathione lyase